MDVLAVEGSHPYMLLPRRKERREGKSMYILVNVIEVLIIMPRIPKRRLGVKACVI